MTEEATVSVEQAACPKCSASPTYHAGLHAGHVWTNVQCPAYQTRNGDDCICDPAAKAREQAGREDDDETEDVPPIDLDSVAAMVRAAGVPCVVEQTGGGCATIYAGSKVERAEDPEWPRSAAAMGPGWFDHHPALGVYEQGKAWREECYIGSDDDGESLLYITTEDLTDEQCASALIGLSVGTLIYWIYNGR